MSKLVKVDCEYCGANISKNNLNVHHQSLKCKAAQDEIKKKEVILEKKEVVLEKKNEIPQTPVPTPVLKSQQTVDVQIDSDDEFYDKKVENKKSQDKVTLEDILVELESIDTHAYYNGLGISWIMTSLSKGLKIKLPEWFDELKAEEDNS